MVGDGQSESIRRRAYAVPLIVRFRLDTSALYRRNHCYLWHHKTNPQCLKFWSRGLSDPDAGRGVGMANPSAAGPTMSMFPAGIRQIPHQLARELNPPARGHPDRGPMGGSGMARMAFQRVRMDPFRQWKPGPRNFFRPSVKGM